jgi:phosphoglycolate phosphatase
MFTSVVFDLDGTLIDSLPGIEQAVGAAVAEVCPGKRVPDLRSFIGPALPNVFRHALGIDDETVLSALVAAFRRSYDGGAWAKSQLFEGVDSTLLELAKRRCRMFVLTNKPAHASERILRYLAVRDLFEQIVAPSPNQAIAPRKAEAALAFQRAVKLDPAKTILVGDSRDDAEAAAACGFTFGAARFGYGDAVDQNDFRVDVRLDRFGEVLDLFQLQPV